MTTFPPSRMTAAARLPRLESEPNPEAWGYRLFTFASKTAGVNAFLPVNSDGNPIGAPLDSLPVTGAGIYVVDCPLGWAGRLVTNGNREHVLFPGERIPEPYTRLSVVIPNPINSPDLGNISDSPVTIAIGPRALEYSRPGWRFHRWGILNFSVLPFTVAVNTVGSLGNKVYVAGYDYWTVLYSPQVTQATTIFRIGLWTEYLWPTGTAPHETSLTPTNGFLSGVQYTTDGPNDGFVFFPVCHGGPRSAVPIGNTTKGLYLGNFVTATIVVNDHVPTLPLTGYAAKNIALQVRNGLSTGPISSTCFVMYAGVYVS